MDFSPQLIALVTFGLLLNAGMLEEVQQASTLTMTWRQPGPTPEVGSGKARETTAVAGPSHETHDQE